MKNSSRKGKTYAVRVPVTDAAEIVNGEAQLRALAGNEHTWNTWQKPIAKGGGVPSARLLPALLMWWSSRRDVIASARRLARAQVFAEILALEKPPSDASSVARGR